MCANLNTADVVANHMVTKTAMIAHFKFPGHRDSTGRVKMDSFSDFRPKKPQQKPPPAMTGTGTKSKHPQPYEAPEDSGNLVPDRKGAGTTTYIDSWLLQSD